MTQPEQPVVAVLNRFEALALNRMVGRIRRNPARYGILAEDADILAMKLETVLTTLSRQPSVIIVVTE